MSTKTIGVVGRGSGWQKVEIELGSYVFNPNSSQPGMFQTFAKKDRSVTHLINQWQGVCRTAPAAPGLSNITLWFFKVKISRRTT